jgi:hypothetical protein
MTTETFVGLIFLVIALGFVGRALISAYFEAKIEYLNQVLDRNKD